GRRLPRRWIPGPGTRRPGRPRRDPGPGRRPPGGDPALPPARRPAGLTRRTGDRRPGHRSPRHRPGAAGRQAGRPGHPRRAGRGGGWSGTLARGLAARGLPLQPPGHAAAGHQHPPLGARRRHLPARGLRAPGRGHPDRRVDEMKRLILLAALAVAACGQAQAPPPAAPAGQRLYARIEAFSGSFIEAYDASSGRLLVSVPDGPVAPDWSRAYSTRAEAGDTLVTVSNPATGAVARRLRAPAGFHFARDAEQLPLG